MRIGFIGAGGIASRHIGNLLDMEDVELVAAADPAADRAEATAARFGGRHYADFEQMIETERLNAAFVCVPPFAHGQIERRLVEEDLPFFVEKPIAAGEETARDVAALVEEKGLITAVGYHWRYLDITERAQQLLNDRPARLLQGYWIDQTPPPYWWRQRRLSGGQMVEQTTHIFDLARVLAGEVDTVFATGGQCPRPDFEGSDICDATVAALRFESGAVGSIASTCLLRWPHRIGLHLFSDSMALEISERDIMIDTGQGRPITSAQNDPFVAEARDFIDAVQGKENRIRAPYSEALRTHLLVAAAERSLNEGCAIKVAREEAVHV